MNTDAQRLNYLAELLKYCPHTEIIYNEDEDSEEETGWTIRVNGCETSTVTAETFREVIDADMLAEENRQSARRGS